MSLHAGKSPNDVLQPTTGRSDDFHTKLRSKARQRRDLEALNSRNECS
jgi:hypothetical protein